MTTQQCVSLLYVQVNLTERESQLPGTSTQQQQQQQQSLDFTDLNPLSPKTQQQPGSARSQAASQSNAFADSAPSQQPATAPLGEEFAQSATAANKAQASADVFCQQPVEQDEFHVPPLQQQQQQQQSHEAASHRPAMLSDTFGAPLPEPDSAQSVKSQASTTGLFPGQITGTHDQTFAAAPQQQQPGSARSVRSQSSSSGVPGGAPIGIHNQTFAAPPQPDSPKSVISQGGLSAMHGGHSTGNQGLTQQPGSVKPVASEAGSMGGLGGQTTGTHNQTSAAPQQPDVGKSVASHTGSVGVAGDQIAGSAENLFVKPTAFDKAVNGHSAGEQL